MVFGEHAVVQLQLVCGSTELESADSRIGGERGNRVQRI
jgi:hypothetical protein